MQKNAWCYDRLESSVCLDDGRIKMKIIQGKLQ